MLRSTRTAPAPCPRIPPCACACDTRPIRRASVPKDTDASCSDSSQLFEQPAASGQRVLRRPPYGLGGTGCPVAQRRGRRYRGRLLLPPYLGEARKGGRLAGRDPPSEKKSGMTPALSAIASLAVSTLKNQAKSASRARVAGSTSYQFMMTAQQLNSSTAFRPQPVEPEPTPQAQRLPAKFAAPRR